MTASLRLVAFPIGDQVRVHVLIRWVDRRWYQPERFEFMHECHDIDLKDFCAVG